MIYNLKYCFLIVFVLIFLACEPENRETTEKTEETIPIDSFDSALPHGSSLPGTELSAADKEALAKSKGKEAILLNFDALKKLIAGVHPQLSLYNFWNFDCAACLDINEHLLALSNEPDFVGELDLNFIYSGPETQIKLNAYIRERQIVEKVYSMQEPFDGPMASEIHETWNGMLPALLIINHAEETELFYQHTFSKEELQAILQPLTY